MTPVARSPLSVALAALRAWDEPTALVMTAIAGAESEFDNTKLGDYLPRRTPNCRGYTSVGWWQIHMPAWASTLRRMGAPADGCRMAEWLMVPINNLRAAQEVLRQQGFEAWTTYRTGAYRGYLDEAGLAVKQAKEVRSREGILASRLLSETVTRRVVDPIGQALQNIGIIPRDWTFEELRAAGWAALLLGVSGALLLAGTLLRPEQRLATLRPVV